MNAVKCLAFTVMAVVVSASAGAQDKDKTDYAKLIVGKWEVSKADEGTVPVGTNIEFTKDGKMKIAGKKGDEELSLEGTYKVEKNTFKFTLKLGDAETSQTITITKISDKEMSTKSEDNKVVEFKKK